MPRISPTDRNANRTCLQCGRGFRAALGDSAHYCTVGCMCDAQSDFHRSQPLSATKLANRTSTCGVYLGPTVAELNRGARGVAASAQPTETQTAARDSAAADGGTCQANTDAASSTIVPACAQCAENAIREEAS